MKNCDQLCVGKAEEAMPEVATKIIYETVNNILKGFKGIYKSPQLAREEGVKAVREVISKLRRGTRKEIERNILSKYD